MTIISIGGYLLTLQSICPVALIPSTINNRANSKSEIEFKGRTKGAGRELALIDLPGKFEEEKRRLNKLGQESLEQGIPLGQNEAVQAQSRKVDEWIVLIHRRKVGQGPNDSLGLRTEGEREEER